jgi:beta-lactamase superfamily II metal-dependent hydrolase
MHELTFFPIGNADSFLIETSTGKRILFDYAHWRAGEKEVLPHLSGS